MKKIIEYGVVCASNIPTNLYEEVNDQIQLGWQPYGTIIQEDYFSHSAGPQKLWYQAMVRYE